MSIRLRGGKACRFVRLQQSALSLQQEELGSLGAGERLRKNAAWELGCKGARELGSWGAGEWLRRNAAWENAVEERTYKLLDGYTPLAYNSG